MPTHTFLPIPKPSRRSKAIYPAPKPARRPQPGPTRTPAPCAPQRVAAARDGQVTCDRCACAGGKRERRVQRQGCRPTLACCTPGWGLPCLCSSRPAFGVGVGVDVGGEGCFAVGLLRSGDGRAEGVWTCEVVDLSLLLMLFLSTTVHSLHASMGLGHRCASRHLTSPSITTSSIC